MQELTSLSQMYSDYYYIIFLHYWKPSLLEEKLSHCFEASQSINFRLNCNIFFLWIYKPFLKTFLVWMCTWLMVALLAGMWCTWGSRTVGVKGEKLRNVILSRRFVGWCNVLPRDADISVNLNVELGAVLGQGKVDLDVASIVFTSIGWLMVEFVCASRSICSKPHLVGIALHSFLTLGCKCQGVNNGKLTFTCYIFFLNVVDNRNGVIVSAS